MASDNNDNINIYVVTYNCNKIKLIGVKPSIADFVTNVIKNHKSENVPIYKHNEKPEVKKEAIPSEKQTAAKPSEDNTGVYINEKNIFIFGIQEAPKNFNKPYPKMLNTITTNLNNNNNKYIYKSYYFDKTTISNTKLFIIYNVNEITFDNEKFIDLPGSIQNKFNKHALRVTIKHNNKPILTVITTHLRKGYLEPFFVNNLQKLIDDTVYNDNIILFGDLNSRTLYKEHGSNRFVSYNDVKLKENDKLVGYLSQLKDIDLKTLSNHDYYRNTLKHKNYYHSDSNIEFSNATNTLKNPTYRYDKTTQTETKIPTLNYWKTKKNKKPKFKVPSYADRVLYKSNNTLTLINDSAHVLKYKGSDHLPVIVKFNYKIEQSNNIYFMKHGHSCSNFVNDLQTQNTILQSKSGPYNITHKNLQFIAKLKNKTHTLINNPNLSYTGYLQTQKFIDWRGKLNTNNPANNIFKLNNNDKLIVFCSPLVRAMETAFFSYPIKIDANNITYRKFSYKYYNFDSKSVITNLNSDHIYVLPFIKEVGTTPDNTMPSIIDSKKKFLKFLDLININVDTNSLFTDDATNLTFINKLTTNYQKLFTQFINKLPIDNGYNYVFVSHNHFIKDYLKYKDPITNTMILNSYRTTIYKPEHITNENENKNENENENICISGVNIKSTPSYTPTKPELLVEQQNTYYEALVSSDKFVRKPLFNIL